MKSELNFFELIDGSSKPLRPEQILRKKVKIVCTMGPSCKKESVISGLIRNGMDVARLNFSHGDHAQHAASIESLRKVARREKKYLGILQDIQGPKIRVGKFKNGKVELKKDQSFIITTSSYLGDERKGECTYRGLHKDIKPGHRIMLDDGLIFLVVEKVKGRDIYTRVIFGGILKNNKGMNLPDTRLKVSCLTLKDRRDLQFGIAHQVDFIALSFISDASDVLAVRKILKNVKNPPLIIAKIETQHAIHNLEEILEVSDGVMVARGDLGVECPLEQLPGLQKKIIRSVNKAGKFVITATQMLESMAKNPRPTRAEASDVANAVLDGTDAVMLSAETSTGEFPVETVRTMSRIIARTEEYISSMSDIQEHRLQEVGKGIADAVTAAAVQCTITLDAAAIVAFTHTGRTAQMISRLRPSPSIFAISPFEDICRRLSIVWGVIPATTRKRLQHPDEMQALSKEVLLRKGLWKEKNRIVMLSGTPVAKPGTVNLVKVYEVK